MSLYKLALLDGIEEINSVPTCFFLESEGEYSKIIVEKCTFCWIKRKVSKFDTRTMF